MSLLSKVKSAAKSPLQKIASKVESRIESEISSKLAKARSSLGSIGGIVNRIDDTLISGADAGFFSKSGIAPERASADEIINARFASNLDAGKYVSQVTPEGKMADQDSSSGSVIQYPPDLGEYYLSFNFMKYDRPNRFTEAKTKSEFVIHLPIPAQLNESHAMAWTDAEQGMIGNLADHIDAAADGKGFDVDGTGTAVGLAAGYQVLNTISSAASNIPIIGSLGVNEAVQIIGQEIGAITNPHISMLFQGPTFRDFQFSWKFHPHSAEESTKIKNIVDQFRKRVLPNIAFKDTQDLIGYPDIVEITLNVGDRKNDFLYPMKKCAVVAFTVNYAPNGTPSFFAGTKAPTFIEFGVMLKEIEYFLAEDFGREQSNTELTEIAKNSGLKVLNSIDLSGAGTQPQDEF